MLQTLAIRYVAQRRNMGELNERSAQTIRSQLTNFAATTTAAPDRLTRRQVEAWMARPDIAPAYRRARFYSLRGFFQWCVINGHMRKDPMLGMRAPKVPAGLPRALTRDEVRRVVAAAKDSRARLIVLLMVQEGLRRVEVARAEYGDLDLRRGVLVVRGKGANGNRNGEVPLSVETVHALQAYLSEHEVASGYLVRSHRGHGHAGISPGTVGQLVLQAFRDSGVKGYNGDGKSGHALRHTAAVDMLEGGATVLDVKEALRHQAISSTMVYLRGVTPDMRRTMGGRSYT